MDLKLAQTIVARLENTRRQLRAEMQKALPVGSLVMIKRGRDDTKTGGWVGPYEVTDHGLSEVSHINLKNINTGKRLTWYVSQHSEWIREA